MNKRRAKLTCRFFSPKPEFGARSCHLGTLRLQAERYDSSMTRLLDEAVKLLGELPPDRQDEEARLILSRNATEKPAPTDEGVAEIIQLFEGSSGADPMMNPENWRPGTVTIAEIKRSNT